MIRLELVYVADGTDLAGVAVVNARDASNRDAGTTRSFWGLYAVTFLAGSRLPHFASGCS